MRLERSRQGVTPVRVRACVRSNVSIWDIWPSLQMLHSKMRQKPAQRQPTVAPLEGRHGPEKPQRGAACGRTRWRDAGATLA